MEDAELIKQLAEDKLGAPPAPGAPAPAASAPPPGAQAAAKTAETTPTTQEAATTKADPVDPSKEEAMSFVKVKFKDGERELTPEQIASTFERYAGLNYEHASMKPVLDLAKRMLAQVNARGGKATPADLAKFMQATLAAQQRNPQMGNVQGQRQHNPDAAREPREGNTGADLLAQWEQENAVSLPPGYRELPSKLNTMERALLQTNQLLQQVLSGNRNVMQQNQSQIQDVQNQLRDERVNAIKTSIGTNLQRVQQQFGFPDEAEQDFMNFAMSRGMTLEDFVDPDLTARVAEDFKNAMNGPEIDRLRAIAARRQAFTGAADGAPGGGSMATAASGADPFFAAMVNKHLG